MTIEQRLDQVEQQNQRIQRTNKRLTVGLTMMAVVVCAVVTMAATGEKDGRFDTVMADTVVARHIGVLNEAGQVLINLGVDDGGDGLVSKYSATAKENGSTDGLVDLTSTKDLNGRVYKIARGGWVVLQFGKFAGWIF